MINTISNRTNKKDFTIIKNLGYNKPTKAPNQNFDLNRKINELHGIKKPHVPQRNDAVNLDKTVATIYGNNPIKNVFKPINVDIKLPTLKQVKRDIKPNKELRVDKAFFDDSLIAPDLNSQINNTTSDGIASPID